MEGTPDSRRIVGLEVHDVRSSWADWVQEKRHSTRNPMNKNEYRRKDEKICAHQDLLSDLRKVVNEYAEAVDSYDTLFRFKGVPDSTIEAGERYAEVARNRMFAYMERVLDNERKRRETISDG